MPNLFRATMGGGGSVEEPFTVIVTLNEDFEGQFVYITQDGHDSPTPKVCPSTAPYEVTFKVPYSGVWTVSSTTKKGKLVKAVTPFLGDMDLNPYPVTLTSGFDYETWLTQGRVTETFASLDDVLADEKTLRQLFTVHDSVDFLANNITDEDATKIFSNDLCAKWINLRDYALDTLYANDTCKSAMDSADKYFYGEWALIDGTWQPKGNVPIMTSNTAPYGIASAKDYFNDNEAPFKAFDGDDNTLWSSKSTASSGNSYIEYEFTNPICIKSMYIKPLNGGSTSTQEYAKCRIKDFELTFDDGSTYSETYDNTKTDDVFGINSNVYTKKVRLVLKNNYDSANSSYAIRKLQFYGRELSVSVPKMTSDTAPYGEAFMSNEHSSDTYKAWKAFDGGTGTEHRASSNGADADGYIGYTFNRPCVVKNVIVKPLYTPIEFNETPLACDIRIEASNDEFATSPIVLKTVSLSAEKITQINHIIVENSNEFKSYRVFYVTPPISTSSGNYVGTEQLNFYGLDYSERDFDTEKPSKYIYDHGLELVNLLSHGSNCKKEIDFISVETTTADKAENYFYTENINTTDYRSIFALLGDKFGTNSSQLYCGAVGIPTAIPFTWFSFESQTTATQPLSNPLISVDIREIDKSTAIIMATGGGTTDRKLPIKEWWLEHE